MTAFVHVSRGLHLALALGLLVAGSESTAQAVSYSIDLYTVAAGTSTLENACFRVTGTIAQPLSATPGNGMYTAYAGFWAAANPPPAVDELFFAGFEEC